MNGSVIPNGECCTPVSNTWGDPLEKLNTLVAWEVFRKPLVRVSVVIKRSFGSTVDLRGRPAFDSSVMFKILVLQALYSISDEQTEFQIQDRLPFMYFLGLGLRDKVPDARTIWLLRELLNWARAVENRRILISCEGRWHYSAAGASAWVGFSRA